MILESIITTTNADGSTNVSPMGPLVDGPEFRRFTLRPYQTSTTYQNLKRLGEGVLNVTDDVLLIAQGAIGKLSGEQIELRAVSAVQGRALVDACHWFAFRVSRLDDESERTTIECEVVQTSVERPFFGFCRAKHAVIEAAILATRLAFLPHDHICSEYERLSILVEKTAGEKERQAFELLDHFVKDATNPAVRREAAD